MLNPYHQQIDVAEVMRLQQYQYQCTLYLEQEVPANSQVDAAVNVTSIGHFMLLSMTGSYTTVEEIDEEPVDNGVVPLYAQLVDGSNFRELFEDYVPANLFLSPGREKSLSTSGERSDQLFLEYPFVYTFPLNGQVILRIQNAANYANKLKVAFKGIRIFPAQRNQ